MQVQGRDSKRFIIIPKHVVEVNETERTQVPATEWNTLEFNTCQKKHSRNTQMKQ